jgi:hypothetical protein
MSLLLGFGSHVAGAWPDLVSIRNQLVGNTNHWPPISNSKGKICYSLLKPVVLVHHPNMPLCDQSTRAVLNTCIIQQIGYVRFEKPPDS